MISGSYLSKKKYQNVFDIAISPNGDIVFELYRQMFEWLNRIGIFWHIQRMPKITLLIRDLIPEKVLALYVGLFKAFVRVFFI